MDLYFAHINAGEDASIVYDAITGRVLAIVARVGDARAVFHVADVTELERSANTTDVREIIADWWRQHMRGGV
ncbi:MAG: hypothetical protein OXE05_12565 [Chloroflexi bacterium]|nr:hypothetical protein [Chloroflexota bacterium]